MEHKQYIAEAFKALEDMDVVVDIPEKDVKGKKVDTDDNITILELLHKEESYITTYDFSDDGVNYTLFIEGTNDGESCDINFDTFDENNIDGVIVEILDSERNLINTLPNVKLNSTVQEAVDRAIDIVRNKDNEIIGDVEPDTLQQLDGDEDEDEDEDEDSEPSRNKREFLDIADSSTTVLNEYGDYDSSELRESSKINIKDDKGMKKALRTLKKSKEEDEAEVIVDASAESLEELKPSYVGDLVAMCVACKTLMFKNPDDIKKSDEESDVYVDDTECPHCGSDKGFNIVGQISTPTSQDAKSDKEEDVENVPNDIDNDIKKDEPKEDVKDDMVKDEEEVDNGGDDKKITPMDFPPEYTSSRNNSAVAESLKLSESSDNGEVFEYSGEELFDIAESSDLSLGKQVILISDRVFLVNEDELKSTGEDGTFTFRGCEVTSDCVGEEEDGTLYLKCVGDEKEYYVEDWVVRDTIPDSWYNRDVDFNTIDEVMFDNLVNRYLHETYKNISTYKTTAVSLDDNNNLILVEGNIYFKSGVVKDTKFIFEAKTITKKGKIKFKGINETFTTSKSPFVLVTRNINNKLLSESLLYNYKINKESVVGKVVSPKKK